MQSLQYIRTRVRIGLIVYFCTLPYRTNIMWAAISNLLKNFAIHSVYFFDPFSFSWNEWQNWNPDLKSHWKWYGGKLQYILCFFRKGGLISESFSLWLISPKRGAESLSWASFFSWIVLRIVIWHPFWEIWAKVKNFLRLSYLYVKTISTDFAKIYRFQKPVHTAIACFP